MEFSRVTLADLSSTHTRSIDLFCQSTDIPPLAKPPVARPPQHTSFYASRYLLLQITPLSDITVSRSIIRYYKNEIKSKKQVELANLYVPSESSLIYSLTKQINKLSPQSGDLLN
ncbi:hypothetical protein EVAR_65622_1 [Eumeta japonica]|uniref:Uncharacterized protein n=1 Tax=Eumeta variegata TaxID=151549 RepID=A0A4C1Z8V4_EUMVA|nr:hypothetical protein EVAR_65622_1 [Eumeta japonica]